MRIGQIARSVGIKVVTIRFYEAEGLVPAPARTAAGYRDFAPDVIARLRFIRRAQELGFTLPELRAFLALSDGRVPSRAEVEAAALEKLDELARGIVDGRGGAVTFVQRFGRGVVDRVNDLFGHLTQRRRPLARTV